MSPPQGKIYQNTNPSGQSGNFFYPCHSSCLTCNGTGSDYCLSCVDPNKRVRDDSNDDLSNDCIVCESVNGLYTHSDSLSVYCTACPTNCLRCSTVGAQDGYCHEC